MKEQFSEVIFKALKATGYTGKKDNKRFKSAVLDYSTEHTDEGEFVFRVVDDVFISICSKSFTCNPEQIDSIKQTASEYLQNNRYHTSKKFSDYISDQIVNGFLRYVDKDFYITYPENNIEEEIEYEPPSFSFADTEKTAPKPELEDEDKDIETEFPYSFYADTEKTTDEPEYESITDKTPDDFQYYIPNSKSISRITSELEKEPIIIGDTTETSESSFQYEDAHKTRKKPRTGVIILIILCLLALVGTFSERYLLEKDDAVSEKNNKESAGSSEGITFTDNRISYTDNSVTMLIPSDLLTNTYDYTGDYFDVSISLNHYHDYSAFMDSISNASGDDVLTEPELILIDGEESFWTEKRSDSYFAKKIYLPVEIYGHYDEIHYVCIETSVYLSSLEDNNYKIKKSEEYFNRIINEAEYIDTYVIRAEGSVISLFGLEIPGDDLDLDSTYCSYTEINLDCIDLSYSQYEYDNGISKSFNEFKEFHNQLFSDDSEVDYYYVDSGDADIDGVKGKWITYNYESEGSIDGEYYLIIPDDKNKRMLQLELEFEGDINKQTGYIEEIVDSLQFI